MPIVRVDVPSGTPEKTKDEIRAGIFEAIDVVLDPGQKGRHPETRKWIYISITEAYGKLGAGLPTVTIDTRPGRRPEQKIDVANRICSVFERALGTRDVYVLLRESAAGDHIGAGVPLPEWKP